MNKKEIFLLVVLTNVILIVNNLNVFAIVAIILSFLNFYKIGFLEGEFKTLIRIMEDDN